MEELRDSSIHHTALKFCEDVKQMKIYNNLYKTVQVDIHTLSIRKCHSKIMFFQKLACSPDVCKEDMKQTLEQAMKKHGIETEIRNIVFHLIRSSIKSEVKLSMQTVSLKFIFSRTF